MPPKCGVGLRVSNRSRGALDKAGVNAEILPTAVVIDKRIADGEQGYSASIEREAGLGAVTTLDDYRAGVAAAIKGGQAIPRLSANLVKLARQHQRAQAKVKSFSSNANRLEFGIHIAGLSPVGLPQAQPGAPASPLKHWCSWRT
jgi:hypothetical protein